MSLGLTQGVNVTYFKPEVDVNCFILRVNIACFNPAVSFYANTNWKLSNSKGV